MVMFVWLMIGLYFGTGAVLHIMDVVQNAYRNRAYRQELRKKGYLDKWEEE